MKYPNNIEKQFIRLYLRFLKKIKSQLINQLVIAHEKNLQVDGFEDIQKIINRILDKIYLSRKLKNQIKSIFIQLNKYSFNETEKFLNEYKKKNKNFFAVQIPADAPFVQTAIDRFTKSNIELLQLSGKEYIQEIGDYAQQAFLKGESTESLIKKYLKFTNQNYNVAEFWAQDQLGNAYSFFTKERQTSAGIPGFIWSTSKDNRVRDSHSVVDGKFFLWSIGALVEGVYTYPGRPYRCRCVAIPAFGDENEIRQ